MNCTRQIDLDMQNLSSKNNPFWWILMKSNKCRVIDLKSICGQNDFYEMYPFSNGPQNTSSNK